MELPDLLGGGIKPPQTGFVDTDTPSSGAVGEDRVYVDIPISAVDLTKAVVSVKGGYSVNCQVYTSSAGNPAVKAVSGSSNNGAAGAICYDLTARLINATTLRLSVYNPVTVGVTNQRLAARWTVVEGK